MALKKKQAHEETGRQADRLWLWIGGRGGGTVYALNDPDGKMITGWIHIKAGGGVF